jgi:hypothetical protein
MRSQGLLMEDEYFSLSPETRGAIEIAAGHQGEARTNCSVILCGMTMRRLLMCTPPALTLCHLRPAQIPRARITRSDREPDTLQASRDDL